MESKTDIKLAMVILSNILFIRPSHSYILTMIKLLVFHYILGALILLFIPLLNRPWMKTLFVFCNFTID